MVLKSIVHVCIFCIDEHVKESGIGQTVIKALNKTDLLRSKRSVKRDVTEDVQTPKFYKLDPPDGRNLYVELGVIVDKVSKDSC